MQPHHSSSQSPSREAETAAQLQKLLQEAQAEIERLKQLVMSGGEQ